MVALPAQLSSPRAKLVYLYLTATGGATIDDLQESLHEPLLSLFKILETLTRAGFVSQTGPVYVPTDPKL